MTSEPNKIGDYHILHPVGRGGMAEVFAVEKTGPGGFEKQLCLKRIRRDLAKDTEFIKSFESEARLVAKLEHPNIVQVFDFFRHEDDLCLVMELVNGIDLNGILRLISNQGTQMPVSAAVYILESLLRALEYAHHLDVKGQEICVIHRDISPQNLLLSNIGTVKLADFGIAKAKGMTPETTGTCLKGKLSYLAPERLKPGKVPIGPESDLFAAGIVFWEMLATRRLFKATMEHQVLSKVMHFEKAPIDYLSAEMNQFIEKLLAPNPENRFHSADEALLALRDVGVQPSSQGDIARLVREMKKAKELQDALEALEQEAALETEEISAIALTNKCNSNGASDEGTVSSDAVGTPEISNWTGRAKRTIPSFAYAVLAGVVLVAAALGIWTLWDDHSDEFVTRQESVQTTAVPGDYKKYATQNDGVKVEESPGVVVLSPQDSAGQDTLASQEIDSATAQILVPSRIVTSRSPDQKNSKRKSEDERREQTTPKDNGINLLPLGED